MAKRTSHDMRDLERQIMASRGGNLKKKRKTWWQKAGGVAGDIVKGFTGWGQETPRPAPMDYLGFGAARVPLAKAIAPMARSLRGLVKRRVPSGEREAFRTALRAAAKKTGGAGEEVGDAWWVSPQGKIIGGPHAEGVHHPTLAGELLAGAPPAPYQFSTQRLLNLGFARGHTGSLGLTIESAMPLRRRQTEALGRLVRLVQPMRVLHEVQLPRRGQAAGSPAYKSLLFSRTGVPGAEETWTHTGEYPEFLQRLIRRAQR